MEPIIEVKNLSKEYIISHDVQPYYSLRDSLAQLIKKPFEYFSSKNNSSKKEKFLALDDMSFSVMPGEVVGIIGRNGAGKSTLLKILSQITPPTKGSIHLRGRVASLLEVGTGFHPELTGRENIFLNGAILGMTQKEIKSKFDEIVNFAGIEKFLDTPVKRYSSGMYVRLAFAVAAHLEPEILIVDEVLAVGDAEFQKKCLGKMNDIAEQDGRTVLFVSHNMAAIRNLCKKCILLEEGNVIGAGNVADIINQYANLVSSKINSVNIINRRDRKGSQAVKFTGFKIKRNNESSEVLVAGESVTFIIEYESSNTKVLNNVNVSVGIDNSLGERIFALSTELTGQTYNNIPPSGNFKLTIPKLPLIPGRYGVTLFMTISGDIVDWIDNIVFLNVEGGDYFGTGKLSEGQGYFLVDHSFIN